MSAGEWRQSAGADGGSIVHTWAEYVETFLRFDRVTDALPSAVLRRNTLTSAAVRSVAARDAARVPVRPITERPVHCRKRHVHAVTSHHPTNSSYV